MATKTITIDMEAYRRLKGVKGENESFSQTIKRVIPKPVPTEELMAAFRKAEETLSDGFFEGVESALTRRAMRPADMERLHGLSRHDGTAGSGRSRRPTKANGRRSKAKAA